MLISVYIRELETQQGPRLIKLHQPLPTSTKQQRIPVIYRWRAMFGNARFAYAATNF